MPDARELESVTLSLKSWLRTVVFYDGGDHDLIAFGDSRVTSPVNDELFVPCHRIARQYFCKDRCEDMFPPEAQRAAEFLVFFLEVLYDGVPRGKFKVLFLQFDERGGERLVVLDQQSAVRICIFQPAHCFQERVIEVGGHSCRGSADRMVCGKQQKDEDHCCDCIGDELQG